MRIVHYRQGDHTSLAARRGEDLIDLGKVAPDLPMDLARLLELGALADLEGKLDGAGADALVEGDIEYLPPLANPGKIICIGVNYQDHAAESGHELPDYPIVFLRVGTTFVGHGQPLIRPLSSEQFDYEGEMVAVIGKAGRHIPKERAHDHVAGYSVFNEASVRDIQLRTSQWTMGKNFDGSGGFGPDFVSAGEVPAGGAGLSIQTRLNGEVVQDSNTKHMIFPVDDLVAVVSSAMTLNPGDIIVTGTPQGIGMFREPQVWMKDGDVCEVEIEGIGCLSNPVRDET